MKQAALLSCIVAFALVLISSTHSAPSLRSKRSVRIYKRNAPETALGDTHTVPAGHNIELECEAAGPTPPLIHWLFNGVHINQGPLDHDTSNIIPPLNPGERMSDVQGDTWGGHEYLSVSSLLVKHANASEHTGEYSCVADLPEERTAQTYKVVVEPASAEQVLDHLLHLQKRSAHDEEPRIYLYTDSVYEFEGVTTVLMCRATQGSSKPRPTIRWSINDVPVTSETEGYKVESNGDLKVLETNIDLHLAYVRCTAEGEDGKKDQKEPFIYLFEPMK